MSLYFLDLGRKAYDEALAEQKHFHELCKQEIMAGIFLKVEHPPVITLGKNADASNLLRSRDFFAQKGIAVVDIDRGGDVTAHMPGQLVVYPILNFASSKNLTPKKFVHTLEECIIQVCRDFDLQAERHPKYPGVWLNERKVCAIGIRIKERVSYHGIALNVCNDLSLFSAIVPCGIQDKQVTSLTKELGKEINIKEVWTSFLHQVQKLFGDISECGRVGLTAQRS